MPRNTTTAALLAASGLAAAAGAQDINFEPARAYFVPDDGSGASPSYVAAGDIDNDGDVDLITDSNGPGNDPTTVFWNDGMGNFTMGPQLPAGWGFGEVDLGDMDGDGDLDVLRCSYFSNGVYFFRNNGDQTFEPGVFYSGGGGCVGVVFADIDGDKDLDFVTLDKFGGQIRPYRNINGLGFTSVGLFSCGADPYTIEAADLDGDGDTDVVVGNEDDATLTVLYNDGTGAFLTTRTVPVGERPTGVAIADLNADGAPDLVSADWGPLSPINNTVSVVLADGDGGYNPAFTQIVQGRPGSVAVRDIDGDGSQDIVVSCEADSTFAVLRGLGDGTFESFVAFPASVSPGSLAIADLDGDAKPDIASVGGDRLVTARNISGTPVEPLPYEIDWYAQYDNLFNEDIPTHLAIDSAGNVIAGGSTYFTSNENDIQVIKLSPAGDVLWSYVYNGIGDHYDVIDTMRIDGSDNIILTGQSYGLSFGIQWVTIKLDADGNELWVRRYDGGNPQASQYPRGLDVSTSGSVAVGGWARDITFQTVHFSVVLYDASGAEQFAAQVPGQSGVDGQAEAVTFDSVGNVIAAGAVDDDDEFGTEMLTAKFAPDGTLLWSVRHDASTDQFFNETIAHSVLVGSGDAVYVGYKGVGGAGGDARVIKYASDGSVLWDLPIAPFGSSVQLFPRPDGTILASAYAGQSTVRLVAIDPGGAVLWSTNADAAFNFDNPTAHLSITPSGQIATIDQLGTDVALVLHDAQGAFQSSTRVDSGSGSDFARAVAASADGGVYLLSQVQTQVLNRRDYSIFRMTPSTPDCVADLAEPFGALDFSDVAAFLTAFGAMDPGADLAEPVGQFDFSDVAAFLQAFGQGCP